MSLIASGSREDLSSSVNAPRSFKASSPLPSDQSDVDDESLPDIDDGKSHQPFETYMATPPRRHKPAAFKRAEYKNGSPQKRSASHLSAELAEESRRVNGNPIRTVRKPLEKMINSRSASDRSDEETSSSSSEDEDSGDEYRASPKKKTKTKAKASSQLRGKFRKKSSGSVSSNATDAILARAKLESAFDYGEDDVIKKSQEESRARLAEMDKRLAVASGSQISSSSADSIPREAKDLTTCPFCFEDMPEKFSVQLQQTMQYWLDQYHQKRRIGSTATLEACQLHRDEKDTIPAGRMKGFKMTLDPERLRLRIRNEKLPFIGHMRSRIKDPESSEWFRKAAEIRRTMGRQADTTVAEMHDMEARQAGYFGELGWETMRDTLMELFAEEGVGEQHDLERIYAENPSCLGLLTPKKFIELVLIPELILLLIIEDYKGRKHTSMSLDEAKEVRDSSTAYGLAKFPSKAMGNVIEGRNIFGGKNVEPKKTTKERTKTKVSSNGSQKKSSKGAPSRAQSIEITTSPKKPRHSQMVAEEMEQVIHTPPLTQSGSLSSRPRPRPVARAGKPGASIFIESSSQSTPHSSLPFASSQDRLGEAQGDPIILSPDPSYHLDEGEDYDDGLSQAFSSQSLPSQITLQRSPSLAMTPENRTIRQRSTSGRIDGY